MYLDDNDSNAFKIYSGHGKGDSGGAYEVKIDNSGNLSANSYTDTTPYPETTQIAYGVIESHKRLEDYDKDDKEKQLDDSKLHEYVRKQINPSGLFGRDLSAVVSCLVEVVKDLSAKITALENA